MLPLTKAITQTTLYFAVRLMISAVALLNYLHTSFLTIQQVGFTTCRFCTNRLNFPQCILLSQSLCICSRCSFAKIT